MPPTFEAGRDGWFLIVDDDVAVGRCLAGALGRHRRTVVAGSVAEAVALLDGELVGLVIDTGMPDAGGVVALRAALERKPALHALVLTGSEDLKHCHEAFQLGAFYLRKPCSLDEIDAFACRALGSKRHRAARLEAAVAATVTRCRLSLREAELLRAAVDGADHAGLAAAAGVTIGTVKNQASSILRKTGMDTLQELVSKVLRDALDR